MGKQERHNIDTIANVLIDKLGEMERTASRIEKASKEPLKIDTEEIEKIFQARKNEENAILDELRAARSKNSIRVPNWVWGIIGGLVLLSMGSIFYAWNKAEDYELKKFEAQYFEQEYNKLKQ
ncbi:hypothetical protein [Flavimarina sp. Hel_I_48]|uniref:hypothetical protein n=1 Tax=Flavimarina sp. Hel_I_48 TaxID=1392488 RepID=UPI0004DEE07D|nr:hypothetical protein [Flavimarina sp. Hel_I_48]